MGVIHGIGLASCGTIAIFSLSLPAFKNHCSFYVVSKSTIKTYSRELKPYDTSGTTIHFSAENPLPAALVKRIVKARIEENELRAKHKKNNS